MNPLVLSKRFLEILFGDQDMAALSTILAPDFHFEGPFLRCASAQAYIDAMTEDPPENWSFQLLQTFENDNRACLLYRFEKPGVSLPMAQFFTCRDGKIIQSLLVFDTGPLSSP